MTQNEHTFVALFVLLVMYQIVWHTVLKYHPVTQKNIKEWLDIFNEYF